MAITDWPEGERPRERLLALGAASLTDAELLAIFLRVGVAGKSAVDLGRELLTHFGSLSALFSAPVDAFSAIHGMGPAKYAQFQAVLELSKRALAETITESPTFSSPQIVRDYLRLNLANLPHEVFFGLWLDGNNRLISAESLGQGSLAQSSVFPREVVKRALAHNAAGVIFAHNHPSGELTPSKADIGVTQQLAAALALVDVKLLDHFIVAGQHAPLSMAEGGLL